MKKKIAKTEAIDVLLNNVQIEKEEMVVAELEPTQLEKECAALIEGLKPYKEFPNKDYYDGYKAGMPEGAKAMRNKLLPLVMNRESMGITLFYIYEQTDSFGKGKTIQEAKKNARKFGKGKFRNLVTYIVFDESKIDEAMQGVQIDFMNVTFSTPLCAIVSQQTKI